MTLVLITTSGTGERLKNLTKYTNKSLVKLGDKLSICYIIELYPNDTEFIITIGYFGEQVKEFLLLAYPNLNFTFVQIDKFEGEGSSLGYSLLCAKKYINKPFYFHCCDTILTENNFLNHDLNKNILFVYKLNDSTNYTSIKTDNLNNIISINKKGSNEFDFVYIGLSYIYNYNDFFNKLNELYNTNPNNFSLSDVNPYIEMLNSNILFEYKIIENWYDTGNLDKIEIAKNIFKSNYSILEKDNESLCFFDDKVIKFINDKKINNKRLIRGNNLYPLTPKIISYGENFIVMEKIKGIILSEYYEENMITNLLNWAFNNLWIKKENISYNYNNLSNNFYIKKTFDRISKLTDILPNEKLFINGINCGKINDLINNIDPNILITDTFCNFHGDFILDNIMKTETSYILLDWRHEFDEQIYLGDIYYDLAKLRHNIFFNHKNIENDLYEILYNNNNNVIVDLKCNFYLINQINDFEQIIINKNLSLKKIKILTAKAVFSMPVSFLSLTKIRTPPPIPIIS